MKPKILFSTKTWQGDINQIIAGGFQRKHERCLYPFDKKILILNNVDTPLSSSDIKDMTEADEVIKADDYAEEALKFFRLTKKDLGVAYIYSICELVELYLAEEFDYVCHFASDTLLSKPFDWITPSIVIMDNCPDVITTAPNNEDSITYGLKNQFFSDQAYLIKVSEWRKPNTFTYTTPELPEYPSLKAHTGQEGDALFERRAGRYLHNIGRYRQLIKDCWYAHPSW